MNGLLLVGGQSTRMGSDKSELIFRDGLTQKERGLKLLASVCDHVFVSTRNNQTASENTIVDAFGEIGPLGAIASAQQADPSATWLVLACDLPMVEEEHLQALVKAHAKGHEVTYYASATDGFPEPLCTIWSPESAQTVRVAVDAGKRCPRSIIKHLNGRALESPGLWVLANTNTEADAQEIRARINQTTTVKNVSVSYFAQLRELTGTSGEAIQTESETPAGLFEELRAKYQLPLKRKGMMVAVNGDFTDWAHALVEGEEIVFIPPVAGG